MPRLRLAEGGVTEQSRGRRNGAAAHRASGTRTGDRRRAMVRGSVEDHLSPLLRGRIDRASGAEVEALGRRAIEEVWSDFAKMLARGNPPDDWA